MAVFTIGGISQTQVIQDVEANKTDTNEVPSSAAAFNFVRGINLGNAATVLENSQSGDFEDVNGVVRRFAKNSTGVLTELIIS